MRPGCCCTTRLRHTEGQGLHSQPSSSPSPTSIHTCISTSSTIRYYPEMCRRYYSAPADPSATIICFRYRSSRARHGSAGIYRTLEDKILQVQSSAWAGRWAESAGLMEPRSPSVATCPQPRMEHAAHTASGGHRVIVCHFHFIFFNVPNKSVSCFWKKCC